MNLDEVWREVEGFNGKYLISNYGSTVGGRKRELLIQYGRKLPSVYLSGMSSGWYPVCQLVAKAFIDNPNNYKYVGFKNGDKRMSRVTNLEWIEG